MEPQGSRKIHRIWWVLGSVALAPVVLVVLLSFVFWLGAPKSEQLALPADLRFYPPAIVQTDPPPAPARPIIGVKFEEILQDRADPAAIAIYEDWQRQWYADNDQRLLKITSDWQPGQPFTPELTAWLEENPRFVKDFHQLAALGGLPCYTEADMVWLLAREDLKAADLTNLPLPDFLLIQTGCKFLCAESRRLRQSGDAEGAADTLLNALVIARSFRRPLAINQIFADGIQGMTLDELELWLREDPPPTALAARLRRELAAFEVALTELEATLELSAQIEQKAMRLEYQEMRERLLGLLREPARSLFRESLHRRLPPQLAKFPEIGVFDVGFALLDSPWMISTEIASAANEAISLKSRASAIVGEFDNHWRERLTCFDSFANYQLAGVATFAGGLRVPVRVKDAAAPDFRLKWREQALAAQTRLRVMLAALDAIESDSLPEP